MSYSIDVNLLLYALDASSPPHSPARIFLEGCARNDEPVYLCYLTLMAYVRMSTYPRIFTSPLTSSEAVANVEGLATLPQARLIGEREGFLDVYKEVTNKVVVRASMTFGRSVFTTPETRLPEKDSYRARVAPPS